MIVPQALPPGCGILGTRLPPPSQDEPHRADQTTRVVPALNRPHRRASSCLAGTALVPPALAVPTCRPLSSLVSSRRTDKPVLHMPPRVVPSRPVPTSLPASQPRHHRPSQAAPTNLSAPAHVSSVPTDQPPLVRPALGVPYRPALPVRVEPIPAKPRPTDSSCHASASPSKP
jgi:hypothetical protein